MTNILSAFSNYLPKAETVLNASDKCEKVLFHLLAHCFLATSSVGMIGGVLLMKGRDMTFTAAMCNQLSKCALDEEFKQKFIHNSIDQASFFNRIQMQFPFVPFIGFIVTTERAYQLGQFFFNAGLKTRSLFFPLVRITAAVAAAFFASVAIKFAASSWLNKEYDWGSWADYWEKYSLSLQIHLITATALLALALLSTPIPINAVKK